MTILRQIADILAFRARASALSHKIELGTLTNAERDAAIAALLLSPAAKPAEPAQAMTAAPVAA